MLLNILVFLFVAMITLYLATQGIISSLIALATAIFSSLLAMALTEPLESIVGSVLPEAAAGATFLLLFLIFFAITRVIADSLVKNNIALNIWIKRSICAVLGFFTALIVVGNIVIGLEMLPLPRIILGFDRFPNEFVMQALDADGKPIFGEVTKRSANIWFSPDRLVLAIWNGASGRALGGIRTWDSVHPDLSVESYGYRSPVFKASLRTAPATFVKIQSAWSSADPKEYFARGIPVQTGKNGENRRVVLVSVEISKGDKPTTADSDSYFRVAASQVRLVTDKNKQYYPVGDMFQGRTFEPMFLHNGFIVDDYAGKQASTIVEDWVFSIPEDEKPSVFELKKNARNLELSQLLTDKAPPPRPVSEYAARKYYNDLGSLAVTFDPKGAKLVAGHVYVLRSDAQKRDLDHILRPAYDRVEQIVTDVGRGTGGWPTELKPGMPPITQFSQAKSVNNSLINAADTDAVTWRSALPLFLLGQGNPDPRIFMTNTVRFISDELIPVWAGAHSGSLIAGQADADLATGKATIKRITAAKHPIIITLETDAGFYVFQTDVDFSDKSKKDFTYTAAAEVVPSAGNEGPLFAIDLNPKAP